MTQPLCRVLAVLCIEVSAALCLAVVALEVLAVVLPPMGGPG